MPNQKRNIGCDFQNIDQLIVWCYKSEYGLYLLLEQMDIKISSDEHSAH